MIQTHSRSLFCVILIKLTFLQLSNVLIRFKFDANEKSSQNQSFGKYLPPLSLFLLAKKGYTQDENIFSKILVL